MQDEQVIALVQQSLKENVPARSILENGLIPGMKKVGELFKNKQYYVPEVLLASEAFYAGFNIVQPLLKSEKVSQRGKVVIGVVHGDIHDIGKNIVKVMIEATGVTVIDLGKDIPAEKFITAVAEEKPDILALSSLMTTTMPCMAEIIQELEQRRLRNAVKVIIGGAPVTAEYAEQIGADAFGGDAAEAISIINDILHGPH
ncbi:MAG: corrinoid protein [candidate division WOR-3 bacterium]|nr:MAG: corrinoid protein [candidate division WOR-3 bacterium]